VLDAVFGYMRELVRATRALLFGAPAAGAEHCRRLFAELLRWCNFRSIAARSAAAGFVVFMLARDFCERGDVLRVRSAATLALSALLTRPERCSEASLRCSFATMRRLAQPPVARAKGEGGGSEPAEAVKDTWGVVGMGEAGRPSGGGGGESGARRFAEETEALAGTLVELLRSTVRHAARCRPLHDVVRCTLYVASSCSENRAADEPGQARGLLPTAARSSGARCGRRGCSGAVRPSGQDTRAQKRAGGPGRARGRAPHARDGAAPQR
jgi:hypothetical protein